MVNRMRGDLSLFADGMREIAARTGWAALGLVPHCAEVARLPAEDAADLVALAGSRRAGCGSRCRCCRGSPISTISTRCARSRTWIWCCCERGTPLPGDCGLVILPGSKATIADLAALRAEGWDIDLAAHVRRGGRVLGLCGGYQMLGRSVADPEGIEGPPARCRGSGCSRWRRC